MVSGATDVKAAKLVRGAVRAVGMVGVTLALALVAGGGCGGDVPTNYLQDDSFGGSKSRGSGGGLSSGEAGESQGNGSAEGGDGGEADVNGGAPAIGGSAGSAGTGGKSGGGASGAAGGPGGGTAGTSGTGGSTTGPVCGNGDVEEAEECDDSNTVDLDGCSSQCLSACEACELHDSFEGACATYNDEFYSCPNLVGDAEEGRGQGVAKSVLCLELVACVRAKQCWEQGAGNLYDVLPCYCGDSTADGCSAPNGVCKDEFEAAAETADSSVILTNVLNVDMTIGLAYYFLQDCELNRCKTQCVDGEPWLEPSVGGAGGL